MIDDQKCRGQKMLQKNQQNSERKSQRRKK
jgi:hypothetical protein